MSGPATLKKISDHLDISISTVSRALKNHPDVSAETKTRVKELADMLDYEPNGFAVNLRKKHSNVFAIMVPEISNFFYHAFIEAVEKEASVMGFSIMILQSMNDIQTEENAIKICRSNHVAGLFVALGNKSNHYERYQKIEDRNIPVVFFDNVPETGNFEKVCLSDYDASWLCGEKLAATASYQTVAILGDKNLSITQRREQGFKPAKIRCFQPNRALRQQSSVSKTSGYKFF